MQRNLTDVGLRLAATYQGLRFQVLLLRDYVAMRKYSRPSRTSECYLLKWEITTRTKSATWSLDKT